MIAKMRPKCVMRFFGNVEYAIDLLTNRQIAFVRTSFLNDPFDPYFFLETDFGESYASLLYHVRKHHPADLPWFKAHVTGQSWSTTVDQLQTKLDEYRRSTLVFCASAENDVIRPEFNLYMWAHYGWGHRGVAVEFDTSALASAIISHSKEVGGGDVGGVDPWTPIEYATTFSPITAEQFYEFMKQEREILAGTRESRDTTAVEIYYNRMASIKSDVWSVENEWRLMWRNDQVSGPVYKCPIGPRSVSRIFLGLAIDAESRQKILEAARSQFPAVPVLQARKRHGEFALRFEQP